MFSAPFLALSILAHCSPASASSAIQWLRPQRTAIIKLDTPGYPLWMPREGDGHLIPDSSVSSAVLFNLTMSADNRTLLLNHEAILPLQNYNVPPQITAYQVPSGTKSIASVAEENYLQEQAGQPTQGPLMKLSYDRLVEADPSPGPPYHNHKPTLRFRIMGLGWREGHDTLETQRQDVLHVSLEDQNHGASDDPERCYAITNIEIKSVAESYEEVHKGPEADVEYECTRWSWTCPDYGMYDANSPHHRFIWRKRFDEFGRIGSLRHDIFKEIDSMKLRTLGNPRSTALMVIGALLSTVLAVIAGFGLLTKPSVPKRVNASKSAAQSKQTATSNNDVDEDDEDEDEAWLMQKTQQAGEVKVTAEEVTQMVDLVSDQEDEHAPS